MRYPAAELDDLHNRAVARSVDSGSADGTSPVRGIALDAKAQLKVERAMKDPKLTLADYRSLGAQQTLLRRRTDTGSHSLAGLPTHDIPPVPAASKRVIALVPEQGARFSVKGRAGYEWSQHE